MLVCPDCNHEWNPDAPADDGDDTVRDANGNVLQSGDTVIVIKDLKLKGSSLVIKGGTKVKNCLLYTSPSPRDKRQSRMPSSA